MYARSVDARGVGRRPIGMGALLAVLLLVAGCGGGTGIGGGHDGAVDPDAEVGDDGTTGPVCGDGVLEGAEECEAGDLGGQDCVTQGFEGGTLHCAADCTFDRTGCYGGCGNAIIEGTEQCDGNQLAGQDCQSAAQLPDGELACTTGCTFDTSGCHDCGNAQLEGPEQCDGAELDGQTCDSLGYDEGTLVCAADCTFDEASCSTCGDGAIGGTEACDGAELGGQTCASLGFNAGTLACAPDCTLDTSDCSTCGDGAVDGAEECDGADLGGQTCAGLGFTHGELVCTAGCTLDTAACYTCGDGNISGAEECDGANLDAQTCETLGYLPGGSLSCDSACLFDRSQCTPQVCEVQSSGNPYGRPPLQLWTHSTVDVQLALETAEIVQTAGPTVAAGPNDAAVTFDQLTGTTGTAGFLLTRASAGADALSEALDLMQRLPNATGVSAAEIHSPGSPTTSHDGYDIVVSVTAVLTTTAAETLSTVRNDVAATLFGLPVGSFTFPAAGGPSGTQFVVSLAVEWRSASFVAVVGAVALQSDYDAGGDVTFRVDDAGGGTGLAEVSASTTNICFRYDQTSLPMADIIWVLDETGSMYAKLAEIAAESVNFFNQAAAYSLDFRMGVVNVEPTNNGVFCTGAGQSADHFLLPSDLAAFQACVQEPWGSGTQAGGLEYGITQGENALNAHLPRQNDANHIRPDATLALIYVTDERAQELKDDCAATGTGMVYIDPTCLQTVIGPTVTLLEPNHPTRPGRAYALVQPPPVGCTASFSEVGQGYTDIANATSGQIHSICPTDLGPFMNAILQDVIAAAAPTKLTHRPISASLAVAKLDRSVSPPVSQPLARSRTDGWDYKPSSNGVVFLNQDFSQLPYEIIISYDFWQ